MQIAFQTRFIFLVLRKTLKVDENKSMVEYPWNWNYGWGVPAHQILETFFEKQNLTPSWTDCEQDWGGYNNETGFWTGAVGEVIRISELYRVLFFSICLIAKVSRSPNSTLQS